MTFGKSVRSTSLPQPCRRSVLPTENRFLPLATHPAPHRVSTMRILVVVLGLLLAPLLPLPAQMLVEVTLEQNQFLPGEAMPATVRVINRSGRTLRLGAEGDWLTFAVQERGGTIVRKDGEVPVIGEFTLESAQVASKKVDLSPYFALTRPGRYHVSATVRIRDWDSLVSSPPRKFDIIEGTKLWAQD